MKFPVVYQCEGVNFLHNFFVNVSWKHLLLDTEMHDSFPHTKDNQNLGYVQYILRH